jgi:flagellar biosynthesis/type III secretory pathway M-ring protein FliF/YscJ
VEILIAVVLLLVLAWFVTAPLRRPAPDGEEEERSEDPRVAELEARKEAKYREIRDAELDRAQGKLSEDDWRRADAELRREAIQILRELDRAREAADP